MTTTPEDAFLSDFHEVATIGATESGGVERQSATPDDKQTRDWFVGFAKARGWETGVDGIDNSVDAFLGLMRGENTGKMVVRTAV
mgnify:CR=1 FL=1